MNALSVLEPFARPWRGAAPDRERCGVCAQAIDEDATRTWSTRERRALLCACATCGTTFAQPGAGGRKLPPRPGPAWPSTPALPSGRRALGGAGDPGRPGVSSSSTRASPAGWRSTRAPGGAAEPTRRSRRARRAGRRDPPDRGARARRRSAAGLRAPRRTARNLPGPGRRLLPAGRRGAPALAGLQRRRPGLEPDRDVLRRAAGRPPRSGPEAPTDVRRHAEGRGRGPVRRLRAVSLPRVVAQEPDALAVRRARAARLERRRRS